MCEYLGSLLALCVIVRVCLSNRLAGCPLACYVLLIFIFSGFIFLSFCCRVLPFKPKFVSDYSLINTRLDTISNGNREFVSVVREKWGFLG